MTYKNIKIVTDGWSWRLFTNDGKLLVNTVFDYISEFHQDYAICRLNNKYTYIKYTGEYIKENLWFEFCNYFYNDIAVVYNNEKYAYINLKGEFVTDFVFDEGFDFIEKSTPVKLFEKNYTLNKEGYIIK
jgi:hypothetical protein